MIIVNYNVKYFLEQCLFSLRKALSNISNEIIVVDNASTDGSRDYLAERFPSVIFIWNKENLGFSKANNLALMQAKGSYILFLNPDTLLAENGLTSCLDFFSQHEDCGALGVRMISGDGSFLKESKRSFPSPSASLFKMMGLATIFPRSKTFAAYYAGHLSNDASHEVDVLAGAFMMLSRKAVEKTGGFDENFFMYGEDIDLSFRIKASGLKNYFFAGTTIIHFKGESTQKISPKYIDDFYGAMSLFIRKHYKHRKIYGLMQFAIFSAKAMARMKLSIRKKKQITRPASLETAVVAGNRVFNEVLQLIKFAQPSLIIRTRVNPSAGLAAEIEKQPSIGQVIFCEGEISFESIIRQLPDLPRKIRYLFHAEGSASIVGSEDKNSKGLFIAPPVQEA